MKKYFLIIDTSSMLGLCAVAKRDNDSLKIIFEKYINAESSHSEHLFMSVQEALAQLKIKFSDLDTIVYCAGPGSFTGLRISYSTVKGFAMTSGVKSHGVSVLKSMIYNIKNRSGCKVALIKGSQSDVYALIEDKNGKVLIDEGCYDINYVLETLSNLGGEKIVCIGSGSKFYSEKLTSIKDVVVPEDEKLHTVTPLGMLSLLEEPPIDGINYLKASYAEIKAGHAVPRHRGD